MFMLFKQSNPTDNNNLNRPQKEFKIAVKDENKLVLALIGLAAGLGLLCISLLFLVANNRVLATRGKVYVQLPDGTTKLAQEFSESHRENEVLKKTVIDFIKLTFEWDNKIPGSAQTDRGVSVSGGGVVPTKAYLASYLLEDGFRTEFLKLLSQIVTRDVYSGNRISIVRFYTISTPRQISQTRWELDTVVTRIEKSNTGEKREVLLNRTYTLQAIVPSELVLGESEPLAFRRQVNQLLKNGVMITKIVQFDY